ncbi:MAG TPA: L-threonylcarbamoyladenylate synthase [Vitreimonas sp.]|nr:L-threonylcarbamoyladenylate synthase [Vitreimonas sp.]
MKKIDIHTTPRDQVIAETIAILRAGGLVIFPTETTYGAGVDALNQTAVDKLLAYKARREGKPLSIAVTDPAMAAQYVEVNDSARKLYERFLPGPVTVVSKSVGTVAQGVASEFGTLGVRIPDYPLVVEIVKAYGRPMTATSANASDAKRPYTVTDIFDGLSEKQKSLIDLVLDAGQLPPNPPSTVIDTTLSTPVVFRQGETNIAEAATEATQLVSQSEMETKQIAGKLLLKHWNEIKAHGLVIGLDGSLGMGKTIFAKGAAEFLGITETVTSPTYTYLEEYEFLRHGVAGKFFHLDLWKIETEAEFNALAVDTLLTPRSVVIIEWFSQVESWLMPIIKAQGLPRLKVVFSEGDALQKDQRRLTIKT